MFSLNNFHSRKLNGTTWMPVTFRRLFRKIKFRNNFVRVLGVFVFESWISKSRLNVFEVWKHLNGFRINKDANFFQKNRFFKFVMLSNRTATLSRVSRSTSWRRLNWWWLSVAQREISSQIRWFCSNLTLMKN